MYVRETQGWCLRLSYHALLTAHHMLPGAGPCAGVRTRTAPDQRSPGHTHRAARCREAEVAGGGVAACTGRQGTGQVRVWEVGQRITASRDEHLDNFSSMLRRPDVLASLYVVLISQT